MRLLGVALLAGVIFVMLWTSHTARQPARPLSDTAAPPPPLAGPGEKAPARPPGEVEETKEMADRLKEAEQKAKDLANSKSPLKPDSPSDIVGVGSSADGQDGEEEGAVGKGETDKEHEAEQELRTILKKAPGKCPWRINNPPFPWGFILVRTRES